MSSRKPPYGPREWLIGFLHRESLLVAIVLVATAFSLFETTIVSFFESQDLQNDALIGEKAPLRNLFELFNFIAGISVAIIALWAISFAKRQAEEAGRAREEAERTRLAAIYAQLEARWSSTEMTGSKIAWRNLIDSHRKALAERGPIPENQQGAVADEVMEAIITALSSDHYEEYQKIISMIDFLEFVGMLESRDYLKINDIAPLLGLLYVDMNALLGSYIKKLTTYYKQTFEATLPNMPPVFQYFTDLSAKFADRFGPSPGGQF